MAERDRAGLTAVGGEGAAGGAGLTGSGPGESDWTASDGRKFGLVVGGAFLALAGLFTWRGHPTLAWVVLPIGGLLAAAGLAIPGRLRPLYRAWMALARAISKVVTPVVLSLVYFLVLTPTGLLRRHLGRDPLGRAREGDSFWQSRPDRRSDLRRQF